MAFSGTLQKCKGCDKVVHFIEMLKADGIPYHKACFKCSHCHSVLAMSSYSTIDGDLYCKPHYEQLFKEKSGLSKKPQSSGAQNEKLNRIPSKNSSFFSGTQEKCSACNKTVYPMEKPLDIGSSEKMSAANAPLETKLVDSNIKFSMEALLQGKPKRLDQRVKGMPNFSREDMAFVNPEIYGNVVELENFLATSPIKEHEDNDWTMVEDLARTGGREEVKLISSSTRGFVVSFGSLIGFLPYCNLPATWKFLAFESWLRGKALDSSKNKQNLGVVGKYRIANKTSLDSSLGLEIDLKVDVDILPDMKLEDLLKIYDQEKLIFLSSFVGQKIKVYVASSDRKSKRLIFSVKPKEKEEIVEKKKSVMAKLSVGDVVKCCIKKITYFGIFVEFVKAKVHRLDFSLERIFLSLKETTPDPLIEALEAVW